MAPVLGLLVQARAQIFLILVIATVGGNDD